MFNKVSKNLLKNFKKMSLKNDAILKTSLKSIAGYGTQNISQQPHGNNLVYDNFYEKSKKELTNSKTEKIIEIFGENLGDLITFYKNLNIRQQEGNKSYFINFQNNIEGVENVLDMFNNNIYTTATVNIPSDANFVPHNMYDPKTGAVFFASTEALHLQYTQLGYTHTKPNILPSSTSSTTQTSSPLPNTGSQVSTGPSSTGSGGGTYSGGSTGSSGGGY
jgi:hypothetical protein